MSWPSLSALSALSAVPDPLDPDSRRGERRRSLVELVAELGGPGGPDPEGPRLFRDLPPVKPVMLFPFCATTVLPVAVPVFAVPAFAASPRSDLGAHISPVNSTPSSTSPGSFSRRLLSLLARLPAESEFTKGIGKVYNFHPKLCITQEESEFWKR